MQVRRRPSLLERPIETASNNRRIWHGDSAYNPRADDAADSPQDPFTGRFGPRQAVPTTGPAMFFPLN